MGALVSLVFFLFFLSLGFFIGGYIERRHFRELDSRKAANGPFFITQLKSYPGAVAGPSPPTILFGDTVISSDYLKSFLGSMRKIFGGEMKSYQSLLVRARREALQRLVEDARSQGYNAVCNVRYSSTDISGASKHRKRAVMVTIFAVATAYHCRPPQPSA